MRSTALPAVSLIPRWLVPSYTLPRVSAPTWLLQQVFSLDSSISGGKWTDSHWKAAKRLVRYIRGATDLCLTFDGDCGKRIILVADHKVRHRPTSNLPFRPIVLSLGGMMNGSTTKVFASWKQVMTRGTYNLMLKRLSLCLLQARVRSFEL
jgi:hypothetical protein